MVISEIAPITYQQHLKTYTGLIMTPVFEIILISSLQESPPKISSPSSLHTLLKILSTEMLLLTDNVTDHFGSNFMECSSHT